MDLVNGNGGLSLIFWSIGTLFIPMIIPWAIFRIFLCKDTKSLVGKVVVITGASSGLGEAVAHIFYSVGCRVILASRRLNELERVKTDLLSIQPRNGECFNPVVLPIDLSDNNSIHEFAVTALAVYGHIDILINNGGVSYRGDVVSTTRDVDYKVMLVNYFGQVSLTKEILPSMLCRSDGYIIFINSVQGRFAIPFRSAYTASKHALQAFADSLRSEVCENNIKVMSVSPGYIQTKLSLNAITSDGNPHGVMDDSQLTGYTPEYVAKKIMNGVLNEKKELVIAPFFPKLAIYIRAIAPSLYFYVMRRRAAHSKNHPPNK